MVKYKVVQGIELDTFVQRVNSYLEEGWEPQGGLCSHEESHLTFYVQALVKRPIRMC